MKHDKDKDTLMDKSAKQAAFVALFIALTALLAIGKLSGSLKTSWLWVFSPIIVPAVYLVASFVLFVLIEKIDKACEKEDSR